MDDLKKIPLHEGHLLLKAKMGAFAGFEMPIQYSSVKEEALAVRENVGMFDVSHMGEFFVEGVEALKFIDDLLPNDIEQAQDGKAIYSPLCNKEGKILDDLIVYKINAQKLFICVNAANIQKDWEWIKEQSQNYDCSLKDVSDFFSLIALQGPQSLKTMKNLGLLDHSEDPAYYSVLQKTYQDTELIIARTGYTGEDGFEIFCSPQVVGHLWKDLLAENVTPCGLAARDVLRLEVCYPLYGHELNEDITPLDCGLKWTVKMNKSHFIGKEALKKYLPKYRLIKLSLDKGIPREGHLVLNTANETIGRITSGTHSVALKKGIALALVEKEKFPEEKEFLIQIRNKTYQANFHTKAFINGGHK